MIMVELTSITSNRENVHTKLIFKIMMLIVANILILFSGFLNTNASPLTRAQVANYGLMDQMATLQWVKENIQEFGGDPNKVTLFGHGTGAACIEYLVHSPTTASGN